MNMADDFLELSQPITLPPALPTEIPSALERLGPSPFSKSGFPFLGFLATVYDHVATHCCPPATAGDDPRGEQRD